MVHLTSSSSPTTEGSVGGSLVRGKQAALQAVLAAPVLAAFLAVAAIFAVIEHDAISAEWTTMYPSDPAHKTAICHCYAENHQFNRLSAVARDACYEKWLPLLASMARRGD